MKSSDIQIHCNQKIVLAIVWFAFIVSCNTAAQQECAFDLSREGFVQELVFPKATVRTPAFDDYTAGSYHIDKIDLLEGVKGRRASKSPSIVGLIMVGPHGPLWAYDILLMIEKQDRIQLNWIQMPHARITLKGTKEISSEAFKVIQSQFTEIEGFTPLNTSSRITEQERNDVDWSIGVLAAFWTSGELAIQSSWNWYQAEGNEAGIQSFEKFMNTALADLTWTYSNSLSDDEPIYQPCEP